MNGKRRTLGARLGTQPSQRLERRNEFRTTVRIPRIIDRIDPQVKVTMSSKQGMPMVLRQRGEPGDTTPVSGRIRELVDL